MRSTSHKEYLSFEEALQELATMDIDEVYSVIGESVRAVFARDLTSCCCLTEGGSGH